MSRHSPTAWERGFAALPRDKTDTLMLVLTSALVLLPFCMVVPDWLSLIAAVLMSWRGWLTLSGRMLPPRWLLLLISAALLGAVYLHFHTWLGKDAGIAFLVVLACLKMLELHARRDVMALIFVCYFLLVGQLLYSQTLVAALYLLFCTALLISVQLNFQYHQHLPGLPQRLLSGFKIIALALPLALMLFVFFPRLQSPLWGKQQGNGGVTGLSDSMEPGKVAELALSDQIAFRVRFQGAPPAPELLYWRGIVLDRFDGRRWSVGESSDQDSPAKPPQGRMVSQEIIMEPHNQRWLFGLDRPDYLTSYNGIAFNPNDHSFAHLTHYGEMRSPSPIQDRIRYTISSALPSPENSRNRDNASPISLNERIDAQSHSLQLPIGFNPLTAQWARQLQGQTNNPVALANLVLTFFREQPFRYTLAPPALGRDQVDDFLFGTQAGFCEHYASSFVVVMRNLHIPARVVTGYQGGERNTVDGLFTIRQADAHAWAEIWIDQLGWLRVDPTAAVAPNRIERGMRGSLAGSSGLLNFGAQSWLGAATHGLRERWDATNSAWNIWILNYNLDKQKKLLSSLSGIEHPQDAQLGIAMMLGASLVVAILSLVLLGTKVAVSPLDRVYAQFSRQMGRHGFTRWPQEGPLDFCNRLLPAFNHRQEIRDFLLLYSQCKYGRRYNQGQLALLKKLLTLCLQLKPDSCPPFS